jgi:hypothetical protein
VFRDDRLWSSPNSGRIETIFIKKFLLFGGLVGWLVGWLVVFLFFLKKSYKTNLLKHGRLFIADKQV